MKRWGVKFLLLAIASILVVVAVKYWPRVLTPDQCSEVYRRYKDRDDLSVAFVKDYRVGDSITVDVTTITAKDSASWEQLLREMNIEEDIGELRRKADQKGTNYVCTYLCLKNHPEKSVGKECSIIDYVIYTHKEMTIYVFDVESRDQADKIREYKMKETFQ